MGRVFEQRSTQSGRLRRDQLLSVYIPEETNIFKVATNGLSEDASLRALSLWINRAMEPSQIYGEKRKTGKVLLAWRHELLRMES